MHPVEHLTSWRHVIVAATLLDGALGGVGFVEMGHRSLESRRRRHVQRFWKSLNWEKSPGPIGNGLQVCDGPVLAEIYLLPLPRIHDSAPAVPLLVVIRGWLRGATIVGAKFIRGDEPVLEQRVH